jgi:hypothetical protein
MTTYVQPTQEQALTREQIREFGECDQFLFRLTPECGAELTGKKTVEFGGKSQELNVDLPCGYHIEDYDDDRGRCPDDRWTYAYSAFAMLWRREQMQTLAQIFKPGDRLRLRLTRKGYNHVSGFDIDTAELYILRGEDKRTGCAKELRFLLNFEVRFPDHLESSAMVRRTRVLK